MHFEPIHYSIQTLKLEPQKGVPWDGRSGTKNFKCGTPPKKMHSRKIAATPAM